MRILAIADVEDDLLLSRLSQPGDLRYDLVISCGDLGLSYLDAVATLANAPLAYVRGNHDKGYEDSWEMGGINLDGRIERFGDVRVAGLEGSLDYREGIVGYSQSEMSRKVVVLGLRAALTGGVDVLVTHAPARGVWGPAGRAASGLRVLQRSAYLGASAPHAARACAPQLWRD